MTPHPIALVTDQIFKELADNLAVDLVMSPGRRQFIETCVQLVMSANPKLTPKAIYYMEEGIYRSLPGSQLHGALERVAAESCARAMQEHYEFEVKHDLR